MFVDLKLYLFNAIAPSRNLGVKLRAIAIFFIATSCNWQSWASKSDVSGQAGLMPHRKKPVEFPVEVRLFRPFLMIHLPNPLIILIYFDPVRV